MFELIDDDFISSLISILGIIGTSYLLEDAAIISAALLSMNATISYLSGFIAIFIGIMSGDLFLYYLGASSHKLSWVKKNLSSRKGQAICFHINEKAFLTIFVIRFIPGLRGVAYLACGALKLNIFTFIISVFVSSVIWCALLYGAILYLGDSSKLIDSPWRWSFIPILLILLWSVNKKVSKSLENEDIDKKL